jgi:hypothetical protein
MNTMKPTKNLPAAASDQMSHCRPVIGTDEEGGSIRPHGSFIDVVLNRLRAGLAGQFSLCDHVHPEASPFLAEPHQTIVA